MQLGHLSLMIKCAATFMHFIKFLFFLQREPKNGLGLVICSASLHHLAWVLLTNQSIEYLSILKFVCAVSKVTHDTSDTW